MLAKSLNFSSVAEQLGISQPALSKQIHNLETELGVDLFDRKQIPISLTPAGEYFFKEAQRLLYQEEQLRKSMDAFKSGEKGNLTIGISPFRAQYLLPKICKRVKEKFPGITIHLQEDSSNNLRRNASEGKYDFAIVNLPVNEAILDVTPIEQDILTLAVPNTLLSLINRSPEVNISKIDFKECENLPFVVVGETQEMRQLFERICLLAEIKPKLAMEVVGLTTAWSMVNSGIGATLLPLQFIENTKGSSDVTLFTLTCDINIRQPVIITHRGQYISRYAKYAIDLLTK